MKKVKPLHCLEVMTGLFQPHRRCDCKKVEKSGRCTCSCNGPSQCGCTCPSCLLAREMPIERHPDLFVLMHPHPTTKAPCWFNLASRDNKHYWSSRRSLARRFASEAEATKFMEKLTVEPVFVMTLPREEL